MTEFATGDRRRPDGLIRLGVGLLQGLVLYGAIKAEPRLLEPAYAAWSVTAALIPIALLGEIGAVRLRTGAIWLGVAAVAVAALSAYGVFAGRVDYGGHLEFQTCVVIAAALFIGHRLVLSADAAGRWIAPYESYFDTGWKDAVRLGLAVAFTGAFWLLLGLGATLFDLIDLHFLRQLIQKSWFAAPATTTVFALAVNLTAARADLVRGARTLALALLSWLLPVMTLIATAFLCALPFTGLKPLWAVGSGSGIMLSAAAALIILINAAYQGGEQPGFPPRALKWSARIAGLILPIFIGVAAYGVLRRIGEHGLTPDRIYALACTGVGGAYALGYAWAALSRAAWMKRLEPTNIAAAHLILAVVLLLFSPVLDPTRMSVADQVGRLERGQVAPDKFDYRFLRFDSGRWGMQALKRLAAGGTGPRAAEIARRASGALVTTNRFGRVLTSPDRAEAIQAVGAPLPPDFLAQKKDVLASCAQEPMGCIGLTGDLDRDGQPEVVIIEGGYRSVYALMQGRWANAGLLVGQDCAPDERAAWKSGRFAIVGPAPAPQVEVDGRRLVWLPGDDCSSKSRILLVQPPGDAKPVQDTATKVELVQRPSQTNRAANRAASR